MNIEEILKKQGEIYKNLASNETIQECNETVKQNVIKAYLDEDEKRLMDHGFGFTGSKEPKPDEGLTMLVEVDEVLWNVNQDGDYLIFRRKDGKGGNMDSYMEELIEELGGIGAINKEVNRVLTKKNLNG